MGNEQKGNEFTINQKLLDQDPRHCSFMKLNIYEPIISSGQRLYGILEIIPNQTISISKIQLTINENQQWSIPQLSQSPSMRNVQTILTLGSIKSQNENIEKILASVDINLSGNVDNPSTIYNLVPGKYEFPFEIILPEITLPSFFYYNIKEEVKSIIQHTLVTKVFDEKNEIKYIDTTLIIILLPKDVIIDKPFPYEIKNKVFSLGLLDLGENIFKVDLEQAIYAFNKDIIFHYEINNMKSNASICGISCEIERKLDCLKKPEINIQNSPFINFIENFSKQNEQIYKTDFIVNVGPNQIKYGSLKFNICNKLQEDWINNYRKLLKDSIYNNILYKINFLTPTVLMSQLFKCEYIMKLKLKYEALAGDNGSLLEIPLFITDNMNYCPPIEKGVIINPGISSLSSSVDLNSDKNIKDAPPIASNLNEGK